MALIGDLVTRENNTLQIVQLTGSKKTLLANETNSNNINGGGTTMDQIMVDFYTQKLKEQSNIRLLTL